MAKVIILEQLRKHEIPGRVAIVEGNGELPKINVETDWSMAEVYLHGAHVTGFQMHGEPPLLFLSRRSNFAADKPIRGGIPIVFPWFGPREGAPLHGFARLADWDLRETVTTPDGGVALHFSLPASAFSPGWVRADVNFVVTLTDTLTLELTVTNSSADQDFTFENCMHTYFTVGDISAVSITGLKGAAYIDRLDNAARKMESGDAIRINLEVDRLFPNATGLVEIHDAKYRRKIRVGKSGSASTVVWNPWVAKSRQMPDFGDDEFKQMVCVESGNVGQNKITLLAGKSSALKVILESQPC